MTRWEKFDDAGAALPASPFEEFDVEFDAALVWRGDVHADGDFTGGGLYRMAGIGGTDELTAFVIDGDLTVGGTLDLDVLNRRFGETTPDLVDGLARDGKPLLRR
ncbi:hypothetical protein [Dactylosporangium sp. NPDC050588]|uniref:hypothetical protein n=1 Tax=Dactylosporangium sp. NPDC050588 TaxID=3157211 RepID=UPI003408D307